MALDFLKAGLLDRAESALNKLEGTAFETQARVALLANYERSRDWALAAQVADKLESAQQGNFSQRLAHYLCEQAADDLAHGQQDAARARLQEAITKAPEAARARMALAQLQAGAGELAAAQQTLLDAMEQAPTASALMAEPLADLALLLGDVTPALTRLQAIYEKNTSLDVLEAIVRLSASQPNEGVTDHDWYARHLDREPSLVAATRWIAGEKFKDEQFHPKVQRALDHAIKPLLRYRCAACGFEATQHFWQCPGCQTWDSYPARRVEEL